nr:MAG TPA: hypothetical protein [Caudoviricetes sp.]
MTSTLSSAICSTSFLDLTQNKVILTSPANERR